MQALIGDSTDNVPGVPGIGVKTAAQLINEFGDLETLLARAGEIKQPKRREALQRECRAGAHLAQAGAAPGRRAGAGRSRFLRQEEARSQRAAAVARAAGLQEPARPLQGELGEATNPVAPPATPRIQPALPAPEPKPALAARAKTNQPFTAADYELIQDEKLLDEWIAEATKAGVVAFDCETDALDSNNAGLVGVSLALLEGPWGNVNSTRRRAAYLPIAHRAPGGEAQGALDLGGTGEKPDGDGKLLPGQLPLKTAIAKLKPLLEDPSVLKVGQNIKYDMCVLRRHGVEIGPVDDTMLLSFVLDAGKHNHGMDELAELLSRPEDHQVLRRGRQRRQAGELRQGADRQGARLRRRGRRRHPAALGACSSRGWPPSTWSACTRRSSGR